MSTVVLLAQAQYQEQFPFLGEFIKDAEPWASVTDFLLFSDVSPRLEEFSPPYLKFTTRRAAVVYIALWPRNMLLFLNILQMKSCITPQSLPV